MMTEHFYSLTINPFVQNQLIKVRLNTVTLVFLCFLCKAHYIYSQTCFLITSCLNLSREHFLFFELGAATEGKKRTRRKAAGREKSGHGREDPSVAKYEKRTGW